MELNERDYNKLNRIVEMLEHHNYTENAKGLKRIIRKLKKDD